ncbi:MAG: hypothetical protein KBG80_00860 [Breznakibacter sp.]|nr:hypothetical protein [Breznakibacter sp.]
MKSISKHLLILSFLITGTTAIYGQSVVLTKATLATLSIEEKQALSTEQLTELDFESLMNLADELSNNAQLSTIAIPIENLAALDLEELMIITENCDKSDKCQETANTITIPLVTLSKLELSALMKVSIVENDQEKSLTLQANNYVKSRDL